LVIGRLSTTVKAMNQPVNSAFDWYSA
jgi:hypothetical protein